jgi:hypothetical protein
VVDAMRSTASVAIVNKLFTMSINPWLRASGVEDMLFVLFASEREMNRTMSSRPLSGWRGSMSFAGGSPRRLDPDPSAGDHGRDGIEIAAF